MSESDPAADLGPERRAAALAMLADLEGVTTDGRRVTYTHVTQAHRIRNNAPGLQARAEDVERRLVAAFQQREGEILNNFQCRQLLGGAALVDARDTPTQQLFTVCNTDDPRLVAVETRCHEVLDQVNEIASRSPSLVVPTRNTAAALFSVMTQVLDASDERVRLRTGGHAATRSETAEYEAAVSAATADLAAAERRATVIAERWARGIYLSGVAVGTVVTLLLVTGVGLLISGIWPTVLATAPLVTAGVFGTLGAVVSVFQRISTGKLVLDVTASPFELRSIAVLRPLVGAVFAAVAELALGAGLLSVTTAGATTATIGSFAVIGFVAGFSERFAIDAIERAGRVLADDERQSGPAKGGEALAANRRPSPPPG